MKKVLLVLSSLLFVFSAFLSCKSSSTTSSTSPTSPEPGTTPVIKSFPMGNTSWVCVNSDTSGNIFLAGAAACSPCGTIVVIKADSNGDCVWSQAYSGYSSVSVNSIYVTSSNIVVPGNSLPLDAYFSIFKTDLTGGSHTLTDYDCGFESAGGTCIESDGSVVVAGFTQYDGLPTCNFIDYGDALLTKVSSAGSETFRSHFSVNSTTNSNTFNGVVKTSDGGYAAVGKTDIYGYGGSGDSTDIYFVKTDASGNLSWAKVYGLGTNLYDEGISVVQNSDNTFMIMAMAGGTSSSDATLYFIKADSSGNTTSIVHYSSDYCYKGIKMIAGNDDGYVIAGRGNSCKGMLLKINSSGSKVWEFNSDAGTFTDVAAVTGGYLVSGAGSLDIGGTYQNRAFVYKINNNGTSAW